MKKIFTVFITILLLGCKASRQDTEFNKLLNETQQEKFTSGEHYLKANQLEYACLKFHGAHLKDPNSVIGKTAKAKLDSLFPILQNKKLKEWQGIWKIKELHFDPYPGTYPEYIEFNNDKVTFYKFAPNAKK